MAKTKGFELPKGIGKGNAEVDNTEIDLNDLTLNVQAARMKAQRQAPYFSQALFAMKVIFTDEVPVAASDDKWRLYFNPKGIKPLSVDELAGVFIHEISHQLRNHMQRFQMLHQGDEWAMAHNIAGDVLINHDVIDDRFVLPDWVVYVKSLKEMFGLDLNVEETRKLSTEEIFFLIKEKIEESCTCGKHGLENKPQNQDQSESEQSSEQGEGDQDDEGEGSEQGEGNGTGESDQESDGEGNGSGKSKSQKDSKGQGGGSGSTSEADCPVHGHNHSKDGSGKPCPACGTMPDCGSSADGIRRSYEAEGESKSDGVSKAEGELIRRNVADDIIKYVNDPSNNRGSMPSGWLRWAEEFDKPVVNWRKELATVIRKTYGSIAGKRDYVMTRPSRRQAAYNGTTGRTNGNTIILPSMRSPEPPKLAVVIDTSGSMSDEDLSWALTETEGVLKSVHQARKVRFISCDAGAHVQSVRKAKDIKLVGGGGTDMRVGIEAALEGKDKAQVVIVLTDGYTPWPSEPLKNATLIVGLTDETARDQVPEWARCVIIKRETSKAI